MKKQIHICGMGRSGSTMLQLMLANGPRVFGCGEVHAWFRPFRSHHKEIICGCGDRPCPIWMKIQYGRENNFHRQVCDVLEVDAVIDSSKNLRWVVDAQSWAVKNNLQAMNVVIHKEPIALSYSNWKRGRGITAWIPRYTWYHQSMIKLNIPFVSIRYEDLVASPEAELKKLCEILGLEYFKGKERFWEGVSHHAFGSMGTRKQLERGTDLKIDSSEKYPEQFLEDWHSIENQISENHQLQFVRDTLGDHSINNASPEWNKPFERPSIMPVWYYQMMAYSWVRKYFRKAWPHEQ